MNFSFVRHSFIPSSLLDFITITKNTKGTMHEVLFVNYCKHIINIAFIRINLERLRKMFLRSIIFNGVQKYSSERTWNSSPAMQIKSLFYDSVCETILSTKYIKNYKIFHGVKGAISRHTRRHKLGHTKFYGDRWTTEESGIDTGGDKRILSSP